MYYGDEGKSTLSKLMISSFGQAKYDTLTEDNKDQVAKGLLSYTLRISKYTDLRKIAARNNLTIGDLKRLRQNSVASFDTNLAIKQMIFIHLAKPKRSIERLIEDADLHHSDRAILDHLSEMRLRSPAKRQLLLAKDLPLESPKVIQKQCGQQIKELHNLFTHQARTKLQFIANSNNMGLNDLENDLRTKAAQTYYHVTPFLTPLYRKNTIINAVKNQSCRIQQYFTAAKRKRSTEHNGEFFNTIRSISAHSTVLLTEGETVDDRDDLDFNAMAFEGTLTKDFDLIDTIFTIEKFVTAGPTARRALVDLLLLQENMGMVNYVRQKTKVRNVDSPTDVYERFGKQVYFRYISEYLEIPLLTVKRIAEEIKQLVLV